MKVKFYDVAFGQKFWFDNEELVKTGDEVAVQHNPPYLKVNVNNDDTVEVEDD